MKQLTYDKSGFYLNGEPFHIISGTIHYFRVPRGYWRDRLQKLKECGFNTVETYTCWNLHEPREGEFHFDGELDIVEFIRIAQELGLYVILRPGPYICAEWEFGGFPSWILSYENMPLRCYDEVFLSKVRRYYTELLTRVKPFLGSNDGPILMIQVENEYGSYGDDKDYLRAIAKIYEENGIDCLYFTSDGTRYTMLTGGTLPEYLCTANFGADPTERFPIVKEFRPNEPMMCAEFWCGWFEHWGEARHDRDPEEVIGIFRKFMDLKASINMYMFHGGTNFGFTNGSNYEGVLQPTITSYDYRAPLTEAGDRTPLYYGLRKTIEEYYGKLPEMTATETPKAEYGKLKLTESADLIENLENLSKPVRSPALKYMEQLGQNFGYIFYRTTVNGPRNPYPLNIGTVHDRAQIFINDEYKKTIERWNKEPDTDPIEIPLGYNETMKVEVLVENAGRINYGPKMGDRKGIGDLRFGAMKHFGWDIFCLPMEDLSGLQFKPVESLPWNKPTFFRGTLTINSAPADTFVRLDGFKKGFVMVNGHNLGRYYNAAGPQKTLYVPAPFLKEGENEIIVFESDGAVCSEIYFTDTPDLG